jgi:3-phosphoshikimate 1-carboxyvinyltransferase
MIREIQSGGRVQARARVPGSKSFTNRALICAALADGRSVLRGASDSDDSALMVNGLNQLGVLALPSGGDLTVEGTGGRLFAPKFPLVAGNAGTTFRFLLSLCTLAQGRTVIEVSERMRERPVDDLVHGLSQLGGRVTSRPGQPRFEVEGGTLAGGQVRLRADKSSQFVSSLLMVAPYARGDVRITLQGKTASASYLAMTIGVMDAFGVQVDRSGDSFLAVRSGARYSPSDYAIEADASGASYPFGAAAVTSGEVFVDAIHRRSLQGDVRFLDVLEKMGCTVEQRSDGMRLQGAPDLHGVDVDMNAMPDVVPTLAAVALFADGRTRIRNVAHLRYKESNRLEALATELGKLGAEVTVRRRTRNRSASFARRASRYVR